MKTDPIFYRLFQTNPAVFFELLGSNSAQASAYEFRSVEIKQTAFRIDGVFIPIASAPQQPIWFVEVQFQKDPSFYFRLFSEISLYLRQYEPINDWQAVVIYPSRSIEPEEPRAYRALFASPQFQRLYLDELELESEVSVGVGIVQLIVAPDDKIAAQARELIHQVQNISSVGGIQREIMDLIETVVVYKFPQLSRLEIETMLGLGDIKQTKVYQEAKQEGLEEGKKEGKLESVPRLLSFLSVEQISQVLDLDILEVQKIAQQKE